MKKTMDKTLRDMRCADYQRQAEALEQAGQWRRAERLWLAAYDSTLDTLLREVFCRRRDACVRQLNALRLRRWHA
ncbi:TPA: hypothetical protein ACGQS5_004784 [Serratia liquefaciens]